MEGSLNKANYMLKKKLRGLEISKVWDVVFNMQRLSDEEESIDALRLKLEMSLQDKIVT